jgi:hypothetical protein
MVYCGIVRVDVFSNAVPWTNRSSDQRISRRQKKPAIGNAEYGASVYSRLSQPAARHAGREHCRFYEGIDMARVRLCAQLAQIHADIERMPMG